MRTTILKDLKTIFDNALATGQLKNMADARALCDLYSEIESSLYDLDSFETRDAKRFDKQQGNGQDIPATIDAE